jgi:hypothetical protein
MNAASDGSLRRWGSAKFRFARAIRRRRKTTRRRTKNFAELVDAVIPADARDKPLELWWQDEAKIGQQGSLTYVWAERGSARGNKLIAMSNRIQTMFKRLR